MSRTKQIDEKQTSTATPIKEPNAPGVAREGADPSSNLTSLQRSAGNQMVLRMLKAAAVQTRLRVGAPGDVYEQEADRVADFVVSSDRPAGSIHRSSDLQGSPGGGFEAPPQIARQLAESRSSGDRLPERVLTDMNRAFGHAFDDVRVHTDRDAAEMSSALNAHAFTYGKDVYFNEGQFDPSSPRGRHLLAHELTHVIQQGGAASAAPIQADFAVEPTVATPTVATLSATDLAAAIAYNQRKVALPDEISLLRDILGLSRTPADVDADFVNAIVRYQASYGLTQDGKLGPATVTQLSKEVIAEGTFLGEGSRGSLELEYGLRNDLQALIDGGNTTYADYKTKIQAATVVQKNVALLHEDLLGNIRDTLPWNNFARCVELLGREAKTYWQLLGETVVRTTIRGAWNDSNVAVPAVGTTQHEEGGWVFLNLITGEITTRRAPRGAGAAIDLTSPPTVTDSIVIAKFHTHPNLGPGWVAAPSPQDTTVDAAHGVPDIVAGTTGVDPAVFSFFQSGPDRREHLAGNRGLPGAAGGLAPQARADDLYDEV